jgi:MFS transporter, SP family, galactose:H+ symporter
LGEVGLNLDDFLFLIIFLVLAGFGVGGGVFISQQYCSEIVPSFLRNWVILFAEVMFNMGILLGYIMNYISYFEINWRYGFGLGIIPSLLIFLGIRFITRSPYWLTMKGKNDEAEAALLKIYDDDLRHTQNASRHIRIAYLMDSQNSWSSVLKPNQKYRKMLLIGFILAALQQLSGSETVLVYAPQVFEVRKGKLNVIDF